MLEKMGILNHEKMTSKTYTVDSLITHTFWWTAQGMGFQGVWTSRRGQTKAKQIKYYLKIQKKNQKTGTPSVVGNCSPAHHASFRHLAIAGWQIRNSKKGW